MAVEKPDYTVIESDRDGDIEIRAYPPQIVAEITVSGDRSGAANDAFRPLARYIFDDEREAGKIAMTAPVTQERSKIAMTAPVTQSASDEGDWTVAFIMPSKWTMETLPPPQNPAVSLREIPARTMAAISFSWFATDGRIARHEEELKSWLLQKGLEAAGPPVYAYYDPPFKPPFLRRNEVLIPLAQTSPDDSD